MKCLACGTETDRGRVVANQLRALCGPCDKAWLKSGEASRYHEQADKPVSDVHGALSRAFADWLTRRIAERRNAFLMAAAGVGRHDMPKDGRGARTA